MGADPSGPVEGSLAGPARVRIVLGLGNPGRRYARTRHNAGFLVVDRLREEAGARWSERPLFQEATIRIGEETIQLARPLTFMNRSGAAAAQILIERRAASREMLVVSDDVALPEGRLRIRAGGGAGGHKGLLSIRQEIGGEEFPRLRIGVGTPQGEEDLVDYVLAPLEGEAWETLERVVAEAAEAVRMICLSGLAAAMNRFHRPLEGDSPAGGGQGPAASPAGPPGADPPGGGASDAGPGAPAEQPPGP